MEGYKSRKDLISLNNLVYEIMLFHFQMDVLTCLAPKKLSCHFHGTVDIVFVACIETGS